MEQQVAAVGDGGGQRQGAQVGGQHGFHGVDGLKRGQAGGQNRAGLVSGGANRGLVFGQDGAGENRSQHLPLVLVLRQHLVADARRAPHRREPSCAGGSAGPGRLRRPGGQGIEVEHEDPDGGVGQHQRDGAGARRNLVERGANGARRPPPAAQMLGSPMPGTRAPGGSGAKA